MNYRHAFHAGNFADLVKHAILLDLMARLRARGPLTVVDTHAGGGLYDLTAEGARSREAEAGVARLMALEARRPRELERLAAAVAARNPERPVRWYPGSPILVAETLGQDETYTGFELRPEEAARLARALEPWPGARAVEGDGYEEAADLARAAGSTLILIDPPFERPDDYARSVTLARSILGRIPAATVAVWLPIKDAETLDAFMRGLEAAGLNGVMAETRLRPLTNPMRLNGCGVAVLNPPAGAAEAAGRVCAWVARELGEAGGRAEVWGF